MLVDISSDDDEDSNITIIENDYVGCNINNKQVVNTGVNQGMSTSVKMVKSWIMLAA